MSLPLLSLAIPLAAQDSPFYRGPNRDGAHPDAEIRADWNTRPPKILWTRDVGYGFSGVAVVSNRAVTAGYSADKKSFLYCLDADSGNELWKVEYPDSCAGVRDGLIGPVVTPAVDSGRLYMVAAMGALSCFDLSNGQKAWEKVTNKDAASGKPHGDYGDGVSPVILDNLVIAHLSVSSNAAAWHAFDKKDGSLAWSHPVQSRPSSRSDKADRAYACAVPVDRQGAPHLLLVSNDGVDLVSRKDGKLVWTHSIAELKLTWGPFPDPLVFDNDKFLLGCWYSAKATAIALQLGADGATRLWQNKSIGKGAYSFVLHEGHAYGFGSDGLQCVELKSGDVKWKWRAADSKLRIDQGEPILVGKRLVWLSTSGMLYIGQPSPEKPDPIASFKAIGKTTRDLRKDKARYNATVSTPPAFAHGRLYCRAPWGDLVCVDVR